MANGCPIRIACTTKEALRELSLVHNVEGKAIEPYDSIIRRAVAALKAQQQPKRIDLSQL
jgi:hypothetical protein